MAAVAVTALAVMMAVAAVRGEVSPLPKDLSISMVPPVYNWTAEPDPPSRPYDAPEPTDAEQVVYRCWGFLARGKATGEMRRYLINGTLPTSNTCDGVNRLHRNCWPIMFTKIFPRVTPRQIHRLCNFCNRNGTVPSAHHFDFA